MMIFTLEGIFLNQLTDAKPELLLERRMLAQKLLLFAALSP